MSGFSTLLENIISENASDPASGFVTKAMINKHLKDHHGYGFVKVSHDHTNPHMYGETIMKKHSSGVKGIEGSDHSPMDATNIAHERTKKIHNDVKKTLINLGGEQHPHSEDSFIFNKGTKKEFHTSAIVEKFPTHASGHRGYNTDWITIHHHKSL